MSKVVMLICYFLLFACRSEKPTLNAQEIIDKSIAVACSDKCEFANIEFTFRERSYVSKRNGGLFQLERITTDSTGITRDVLTNSGFQRFKNDTLISLTDSVAFKYANSVNAVHYFAQLPFGLNAPAVIKELVGEAHIKGENYYEIAVSFDEENGGKDFDDTFLYWIHKDKYTVDYLAYKYAVDGGGIRFREAYNIRVVKGIRFADYFNYKPVNLEVALSDLDEHFKEKKLTQLSKIETESVGVNYSDNE